MKKIFTLLMVLLTSVIFFASKAEAKWWIFGQGNDEIRINYLYLNKNSYDELDKNVVLYKDNINNGTITINGKASVKRGKIGYVKISKDGKNTWQDANISDNGAFEYKFTPLINEKYEIFIEISDTTGKINNVEDTYRKVTVIDENITEIVRKSLDSLVKAYENEEENLFMLYVSPDFTGDFTILDSAVRRDFNAFDHIQLKYFINNISTDGKGRTFVSISYIRTVVSTKSGRVFSDNGFTELIFKNQDGTPKVLSMKNPLIFGLSDAGNVATGTIQSTNNNPMLLVDNSGNVDEKPFRDAIRIIEDDSDVTNSSSIQIVSFLLDEFEGIIFESQTTDIGGTDIYLTDDAGAGRALEVRGRGPAEFSPIGACSLSSVTEAPSGGYMNDMIFPISSGVCYGIRTVDNTYAVVKVTNYNAGAGTISIQYKYQPDGSRNF